jgi:hypothetical protein
MSLPTGDWEFTLFVARGSDFTRVRKLADGRYQADLKSGDGIVLDRAAIRAFAAGLDAHEEAQRRAREEGVALR